MKIDKYTRRIENENPDLEKYTDDIKSRVEWCWNKDEIAWQIFTHDGSITITRVKMTGEHWLSNLGWARGRKHQIYQYEKLDASSYFDKEKSHSQSNELFETLEGVKQYAKDYFEEYLERCKKTVEDSKTEMLNFTKKYDNNRPEKLERILDENNQS